MKYLGKVHKTRDLGIQDPEEGFAKWGRFHLKITRLKYSSLALALAFCDEAILPP